MGMVITIGIPVTRITTITLTIITVMAIMIRGLDVATIMATQVTGVITTIGTVIIMAIGMVTIMAIGPARDGITTTLTMFTVLMERPNMVRVAVMVVAITTGEPLREWKFLKKVAEEGNMF